MPNKNTQNIFPKASKIHFVGVGGIGVSAVARWLCQEDKTVSGSDVAVSDLTRSLADEGVLIFRGHDTSHITKVMPDAVVASLAIPDENPEVAAAKRAGIPVLKYPEALGALANTYNLVAVSGTNGKSTTTAMIGLILLEARQDPTILVGSIIKELESNFRKGASRTAVIEACEYKRAFLAYQPNIAVITNIEPDHLDYYRSIEDIIDAFTHFALNIKSNGTLVINGDDQNAQRVLTTVQAKRPDIRIVTFGKKEGAEARISGTRVKGEKTLFHLLFNNQEHGLQLNIPGEFNAYNAAAAFTVSMLLGADPKAATTVFAEFHGIWRRFERVGEFRACPVISDYAHHPTAIEKTILAARSIFPKKRIVAVFEPHQHNRTRMLFDDFVKSFDEADVVICSEIYTVKGRITAEDAKVSSADLISSMKDRDGERGRSRELLFAKNLSETEVLIRKHIKANDCLLIVGAGDIGGLPLKLIS